MLGSINTKQTYVLIFPSFFFSWFFYNTDYYITQDLTYFLHQQLSSSSCQRVFPKQVRAENNAPVNEWSHWKRFRNPSKIFKALNSPDLISLSLLRSICNYRKIISFSNNQILYCKSYRIRISTRKWYSNVKHKWNQVLHDLTYWARNNILRSLVHKSTASCFRKSLRLSCFGEVTSKSSVPLTCKNLLYFDILDSQLSSMNCNACSSISGYLKSFLEVLLFDAAAAIC